MKKFFLLILILLLSSKALAQGWSNPSAANTMSNISVGVSLGLDVFNDFRAQDRKHAFLVSAERIGLKILIAEVSKHFIHEDRPDHSDNKSFYSEHTELATSFSSNFVGTLSFAAGTGYLRMAADKHHLQDVLVGAGAGVVINQLIK